MNEPHVQAIVYEFGDFRLEPARRALTRRDGRPAEITAKAFDALLVCLIEHAGTVVARGANLRKRSGRGRSSRTTTSTS